MKGKLKIAHIVFLLFFLFHPFIVFSQISFVQNHGQWDHRVLYQSDIPGGKIYIQKNALTYCFFDGEKLNNVMHGEIAPENVNAHAFKVEFLEANEDIQISQQNITGTHYNYFIGNDKSKWASNVQAFKKLTLKNLYPGIDLEVIGQNDAIKYNFIVSPGSSTSQIKIKYTGADNLNIKNGTLFIETSVAEIKEDPPVAFQNLNDEKASVQCKYKLNDNIITFDLSKGYVDSVPLIIDPTVIFATFSGSYADNWGFTGTFDQEGHAYSGGTVYGPGYPATTGAFQLKFGGGLDSFDIGEYGRDIGILKYSADGSMLLYATYIGGSHNEQPHSMVVNNEGDLIIYGTTHSYDFPGTDPSDYKGNYDIFVVKIAPDGSKLLQSKLFGGSGNDGLNGDLKYFYDNFGNSKFYNTSLLGYNYGDNYRGEVIVDDNDNVYVASCTRSWNFPSTYSSKNGGNQDACLLKLNKDLKLIWSRIIGGSADDAAYSLNINNSNDIYVVGGTASGNLEGMNGYQKSIKKNNDHNYQVDGFIYKISNDGSKILKGTYLGTENYDQIYFVQLDENGNVYVTGQTEGLDFPVKNVKISDAQSGQFITKFNPDLSSIIYSTVFGTGKGTPDISPSAFLVDICENVYVSGWGSYIWGWLGPNNPGVNANKTSTTGLPFTDNAYQKTTDGNDFYIIVFKKDIDSLLYATYLGGSVSHEHVDGGTSRFDKNGVVYQSVCGGCGGHSDFPVTDNAYSRYNNSRNCNNAFFKMNLDVANNAPRFKDPQIEKTKFIHVFASDTINIPIDVIDPNESDSVFLSYKGDIFDSLKINPPIAHLDSVDGIKRVSTRMFWPTGCQHISKDTFYVDLFIHDLGCPVPKANKGRIGIIVDPPPLPEPPSIFCSKVINENTLEFSWDTPKQDKYFKHFLFKKRFPDGREVVLDTITRNDTSIITDSKAFNHEETQYCYYLFGENICGDFGDSSYEICTGPNNPEEPSQRYVFRATVNDNKDILLEWDKAPEADFRQYDIYRKINSDKYDYKLLHSNDSQTDTNYIDTFVDINEYSYCYKIEVLDVCGFKSDESNKGCSILLKGKSIPFEHKLFWNPYELWSLGVESYDVERKDPLFDNKFSKIMNVNGKQVNYVDKKLNYDVGAYWYRVTAYENERSKFGNDHNIKSVSNEVYLVQAPLLHVPNAFTINGDGINDVWGIDDVFVKDYYLQVFNRWGEKIFETSNKYEQWDGTCKSCNYKNSFDNVFVYLITYTGWDNSTHYVRGNVTVLK